MNVRPIWTDREEAAGVVEQALDATGARAVPSSTSCSRRLRRIEHQRDLGRDEDALEERQDDEQQDLAGAQRRDPRPASPAARRLRRRGVGRRARRASRRSPDLADPGRDADGELARRHVWVTTAPAPVSAPSPERDGRAQHRVHAQEHALADRRAVLAHAVVVGGDRARADVGVPRRPPRRRGSSCGAGWTCSPRRLFLISAKLPTSERRPDEGARAQVRERADRGPRPRPWTTRHARPHDAALADRSSRRSGCPAPIRGPAPDARPAAQDHVGLEHHVLGQLDAVRRCRRSDGSTIVTPASRSAVVDLGPAGRTRHGPAARGR